MPSYNPAFLMKPKSAEESVMMLKEWGTTARLVAGNTTIYELANQGGLSDVERLIDITELGLDYVREVEKNRTIAIGATTTFSELASCSILRDGDVRAISETAEKITPPQVRNTGTIGGSLCSGIPFYDMPTCFLALDAKLKILSPEGERNLGIEELFLDYFVTAISGEELVVEATFARNKNSGSAFLKLGRTYADFAVVNAAASVALNHDKSSIADVRIALGAVANTPIRAKEAEQKLKGTPLEIKSIVAAAKEAANFDPTPSVHASSSYKRRVIPVLVRDVVLTAVERAGAKRLE